MQFPAEQHGQSLPRRSILPLTRTWIKKLSLKPGWPLDFTCNPGFLAGKCDFFAKINRERDKQGKNFEAFRLESGGREMNSPRKRRWVLIFLQHLPFRGNKRFFRAFRQEILARGARVGLRNRLAEDVGKELRRQGGSLGFCVREETEKF